MNVLLLAVALPLLSIGASSFEIAISAETPDHCCMAAAEDLPDFRPDSLIKTEGTVSSMMTKKWQVDSASAKDLLLSDGIKDSAHSAALETTQCRQQQCAVWARISKGTQRLYLYVDGKMLDSFKVSTGDTRHETPLMDLRPRGPVYQKYTSRKFPGGDYRGMGNMPYVVFLRDGYGLHGTTPGNFSKLGRKASHGCIRLHPDNARIFNELVRKSGLVNTWITIEE